ncbi:MAG: MmgE/PrpD family protein [Desulfobacterales bacterium]|nr:MmgE/PrpD family protein [Desulfobacterales bacterium]
MDPKKLEVTKKVARFVVETDTSDIPPIIYEHAKVAFQDWFAVTMAGKDDSLVLKLLQLSNLMGGNEHATVLGHDVKINVCTAALINASASHVLDYDDTIFVGSIPIHPTATLFPSVLALSEWKEFSGKDLLTAYIVGFKVGAFVGECTDAEHYESGWHATSTFGHLASAAACANLLKLDEKQTVHALGIAGTQACGLKIVFGTMCKSLHAGRAAQHGLEAALLAQDGFTSAEDILEGPAGFFQLFQGEVKEDALSGLGKTWNIERLAQKYHASAG